MYKEFAGLYDELMNDFDYEKWFNYIEAIFKKERLRPRKVLEMACGTGNLSYYLAREGYKLTCFDLSQEMLGEAYEKLRPYKNARVLKQDMVDFKFSEKFNSIISICDSVNYILREEDLQASFNNVYNHLEDDGVFIFDINSYYKLSEIIGNNIFLEDRDNIFYSWQNEFNEESKICDFYLTFFYSEDGESFQRADEYHQERAYTVEEIKAILKNSGFTRIKVYDAFTFDDPKEKSERINFVVRK